MVQQKENTDYKHLSQEEREEIFKYKAQWKSFRWIGRKLERSHTSIWRERKRNREDKGRGKFKYSPSQAQKRYEERRNKANFKLVKLRSDDKMREILIKYIKEKSKEWGIDEIVWRLKLEWYKMVSTSAVYRFIREEMPELQKYLRCGEKWYRTKKKGNKRKKGYTDVPNIKDRPEEANNRREIWHWEWDTVVSGRKAKGWIVSMYERVSRYYIIKKIGNLKAETVRITIEAMMKGEYVKSSTFDNGVEFRSIWKLPFNCYRADPYASYQRGWNERHNGLFRVYVPKGSDISKYTEEEIKKIENKINNKPRKILWYKSPYEIYHGVNMKYIK